MTNAILRGKPDAGSPSVRFDEGGITSARPRRVSLLYNIHLCAEGCGCSRWFAAGVLFLFALPVVAESLSVTCRIVREDGASETRACPLVASDWDLKLLKYGADFEREMMDLSVNIPLEQALDLGWRILAANFAKDEVGIPSKLTDRFWPVSAN